MNLTALLASAALLGLLAAPAVAQSNDTKAAVTSSPGKGTATRTRTVVATVTEVDAAKGHVTLKGPKGNSLPLQVGPDVRNLDKVAVGDRVTVKYLESLSLELKKDGKALTGATAGAAAARAPKGSLPAGVVAEQVEVTAEVVAVNSQQQTITLKGPQRTVELWIQDPKQFKLVKVGDHVQAMYTQALALAVDPAPKAKK